LSVTAINAINSSNVIDAINEKNQTNQISQMNKPSALYILSVHGMIEPDVNLEVTNAI
jgi:hypothetical protein